MTGSPGEVSADRGDLGRSGAGPSGASAPATDIPEVGEIAAQLDRVEVTLGGVVAALTRLDEGRYDHCTRCGAPLDSARLAADPLTEHCPDGCGATP